MERDARWYAGWVRLLPASSPEEKMRNLEAADMLEKLSDRVEVVLCKECKYSDNTHASADGVLHCNQWDTCTSEGGYCHRSEKAVEMHR